MFLEKKKSTTFFTILVFCINTSIVFASQSEEAIKQLENPSGVYKTLVDIMSIMAGVGVVICVAKLMHIGIKFITQPAGGRSNAKESLLPWFIGAMVLATFASLGPWLISNIEGTEDTNSSIFDI